MCSSDLHAGEKPKGGIDLTRTPDRGFTKSYGSLCGGPDAWRERHAKPELDANDLVPRYWQRNQIQITPPDDLRAARQSRLIRMLTAPPGHQGVKLPSDDLRRLAAWIDLNAIFYGVYDAPSQARQLAGDPVPMPEIR